MIEPGRQRRRRNRGRIVRGLIAFAVVALVFAGGVAVGEALQEGPQPRGPVTRVRTLEPLQLPPVRETVTVTNRSD